jgi:hypothetical protein
MTAPAPAALLAAMEAAARQLQAAEAAHDLDQCDSAWHAFTIAKDAYETACIAAAPVVAGFSAALRASQEREAAAVEELDAYREAAMYDVKMGGSVFSHWNRSQLDRARAMTEAAIRARQDAAP